MCMNNAVRIESKDVPEYGYKVYCRSGFDSLLRTYFKMQSHIVNEFNKSECHKKQCDDEHLNHGFFLSGIIHFGRISVFRNKEDAIKFCRNNRSHSFRPEGIETWKVKIKQTTKYAYKGLFCGSETLVVDQVKPIEKVI